MNVSLQQLRKERLTDLRQMRRLYALHVEEYIAECEHQEGPEYWDQFEDINDMLADFDIYMTEADNASE